MDGLIGRNEARSLREREVWALLAEVMDPELDESVTDLNFITNADVDAENRVHIGFRLPTYWCAANFAFLMADDMRVAVETLDWVEGVVVTLGDHMYADKINAGLRGGRSFQDTFGDEADGDLDALRQTFLVKAFQRRQAALLNALIASGLSPQALVGWSLSDLNTASLEGEIDEVRRRYLDRRSVVGPMRAQGRAFVNVEGEKLESDDLPRYLKGLRRVGVNAEFNGALCRGLLAVRFDLETPLKSRSEAAVEHRAT